MATLAVQGVYAIVNTVTGRRYIGSSKHVERRWSEHRWQLARGVHKNRRLQRAWLKYGSATFELCILEEVTDPAALWIRERVHIESSPDRYNLCLETGRPPTYRSPEHRAKIGAAHRGRVFSESTLAKMRASQQRRAHEGRMPRMTPEQRAAQSAYRRARPELFAAAHAVVGAANARRVWTQQSKQKSGASHRGHWATLSPEERDQRLRAIRQPLSKETLLKISTALKGRPKTPEHRAAIRAAALRRHRGCAA